MKLQRLLAFPIAGASLVAMASAQVVYGTDAPSDDVNFLLNINTGVSTGPLFTGQEMFGLADDDPNQLLYMSEEGTVSSWTYGSPSPPSIAIAPIDPTNNNSIRCEAMAFNAGVLYGVDEFGAVGQEGIYSLDLVTGDATPVLIYGNVTLDIGGLDIDPATGLFYGSSDAAGAQGIVQINTVAATETIIAPYLPTSNNDIDGLAFNPNGTVYLIQDQPTDIDVFNVATATYTGTLPSAIPAAVVFSAGTWSDVLGGGSGGAIGTNYCTANPNSTGVAGSIAAFGSTTASDNNVTLTASNLPVGQFGIFVTSRTQDFVPNVGSGNLCLGGLIGRYQQPGQILQVDAAGQFSFQIDTTGMPQGLVLVAINPGETWNFQAWHRDFTTTVPMTNTSNLTNAVEIAFN